MAAYTSSGTGFWDLPGTWGNVGVPTLASGDTATIAASHTVTARSDAGVGNSPASGTNVLVNNGVLVINSGVTFTVRGDVLMSGTTSTNGQINCAGNWVFDGTAGAVKYKCSVGGQHSTTAKFILSGTSGAHASCVSLGTGAANGYFDNSGWIGGGRMESDYADFTQVGDATNFLAKYYVQDISTHNVFYRNCTFTGCGRVGPATGLSDHANFQVSDCLFRDTKDSGGFCLGFTGSATATGLRVIRNNRFDRSVNIITPVSAQITDNVFGAGYQITTGIQTGLTWSRNLSINTTVISGMIAITTMNGDYIFDDSSGNCHPLVVNSAAAHSILNLVFDSPAGVSGDMIVGGPGGGPYAMTVTGCLVVANSAGTSIGELISPTASGMTYTVEHNTVVATAGADSGVGVCGETYAGRAGMYASIRSNVVYSPTGHGTALLRVSQGTVSDPLATPSMGDYNAFNSPFAATGVGVYAVYGAIGGYIDIVASPTVPMFTTTTGLGAHDFICASPGFVDTTRCLATFDTAYLGNTATAWATATAYAVGDIRSTASSGFYGNATVNFRCILAHTSASGNATNGQPGVAASWRTNWELASAYRLRSATPVVYSSATVQATPQDLWTWVRAGWAPTNAALKGTAHDGGDVGAIAVLLTVSTRGRRNVPRGLGRGLKRGVA